ncbi:MAG: cysteine synthase A [Eubacteriales bacterium]|nr:cysteine synthase A [Eubacteriales bacterium]
MAGIYQSAEEFIGKTPLLEVCRLEQRYQLNARVLVKLEYLNPGGSVKDRAAKYMLEDAEKNGLIGPGAVIIEPTSGNTGIGLAMLCAARGYRMILTMPETMSVERINLLKAYGAEVVLTEGSAGMAGAIEKAEELSLEIPGSFIPGQFDNQANARAHYETTGPELWEDTEGKIDYFVAGVGSGGTITGAGRYLKEKNPDISVIAVEPAESPLLSGGKAGAHGIQGIGANFIPDLLDRQIYDQVHTVELGDAYKWAKRLAKYEGILTGISSGAALFAAVRLAEKEENKGKTIVVLLPDSGDRYFSTPLFTAE